MPTDVVALAAQSARSPAFRIRVVLPAGPLFALGVAVRAQPLFSLDEAERFAKGSVGERLRTAVTARRRLTRSISALDTEDTVLVQRQADILPMLTLERRAVQGRRLVLDVDDAIWHDGAAGGHPLAWLKGSRRKVDWLASRADTCIAGNELLAEYLRRHSPDVRVIPSLVDVRAMPVRRHTETARVVLGWIGSPSTVAFLEAKRQALERLGAAVAPRPLELLVVGGELAPVTGIRTTVLPWSETNELEALARMDIGLMPIEDTAFARGKCAYKALQYMAAGIPVVADDVGISAAVIGDRSGGLIARGPSGWVDAVETLSGDHDLRTRLGAEGRRRVTEGFSYERWMPELAKVLGEG